MNRRNLAVIATIIAADALFIIITCYWLRWPLYPTICIMIFGQLLNAFLPQWINRKINRKR